MSALVHIHTASLRVETKKSMEFMNDKQNTRDVNPAFNAVFDIHVPQEGELVVSECGEDLTPEFSAHRAVRHVVQGIDLPVTEPTGSAPLP